ncbi:MAG: nucleoside monophosphate kinase, partial [Anaerolineae bacterium]|nr:nucleoside monophosphate kinase [Anaerolineae bacterium]
INLHARRETLIQRLSGRWMCRSCGASYHTEFNPPKHAAHCDECGAELYQRQDDSPETVAHRLDVYTRQTAPLQSYYRDRGTLVDIDGERGIDDVCAAMKAALGMREKVTV